MVTSSEKVATKIAKACDLSLGSKGKVGLALSTEAGSGQMANCDS